MQAVRLSNSERSRVALGFFLAVTLHAMFLLVAVARWQKTVTTPTIPTAVQVRLQAPAPTTPAPSQIIPETLAPTVADWLPPATTLPLPPPSAPPLPTPKPQVAQPAPQAPPVRHKQPPPPSRKPVAPKNAQAALKPNPARQQQLLPTLQQRPPPKVNKAPPQPAPKPVLDPKPRTAALRQPAPTPPMPASPQTAGMTAKTIDKPIPPIPVRKLPAAPRPVASASRLDSASLLGQVAQLETEQQRAQTASAGRVQRVRPSDTGSAASFYAADWARKVTRVGEMNFPDAARRLQTSSGPALEVIIAADGQLREVRIARSSGYAELDEAARRIVKLAAPFPPFPPTLRRDVDVLHIATPWRFHPGGRIQAR